MTDDIAIALTNVSKVFKRYHRPVDRLKELLLPGKQRAEEFCALQAINLEIEKGDTVGIIGRNGSGKSTLLQIIAGTLQPTTGNIKVNGRVSALLELGSGFNPEFTGRQNVFFNGRILGLSQAEVEKKFDEIAAFADIDAFIDQPVKTYSSGMFIRLGFAVAVHVEPEILIVDEALAVGDMFFQAKCMAKMQQLIETGVTILFVSHDSSAVKSVCKRALLLQDGKSAAWGKANDVVEKYFSMKVESEQVVVTSDDILDALHKVVQSERDRAFSKTQHEYPQENSRFLKRASFQRIQNGMASFENVQLLDISGKEIVAVNYEQTVTLRMTIKVESDIDALAYGYHIRDKNGVDVVYSDSVLENSTLTSLQSGDRYTIDWQFTISLTQGQYNISCVLSIPLNWHVGSVNFCDFVPIAAQFSVSTQDKKLYGSVHWNNDVKIQKVL